MLLKRVVLPNFQWKQVKFYSNQLNVQPQVKFRTESWHLRKYGTIEDLQLEKVETPTIRNGNSVQIRIDAASLNPIDLRMIGGAKPIEIGAPRYFKSEPFPLTLGRDFVGTIVERGYNVPRHTYPVGTRVYGFVPVEKRGSFSRVIVTNKAYICPAPDHLTAPEIASLIYTSLTAWCSLFLTGRLLFKRTIGVRVLILGASGGVGTAAIQMLKAHNCEVVATCAADAAPLLERLGADKVIDYKSSDFEEQLRNLGGKFDIVFDCARIGPDSVPKVLNYWLYIGLNSPLDFNTYPKGVAGVSALIARTEVRKNVRHMGCGVHWAISKPSRVGLLQIDKLIRADKIRPVIQQVFNFSELPEALRCLEKGHLRGKLVLNYT